MLRQAADVPPRRAVVAGGAAGLLARVAEHLLHPLHLARPMCSTARAVGRFTPEHTRRKTNGAVGVSVGLAPVSVGKMPWPAAAATHPRPPGRCKPPQTEKTADANGSSHTIGLVRPGGRSLFGPTQPKRQSARSTPTAGGCQPSSFAALNYGLGCTTGEAQTPPAALEGAPVPPSKWGSGRAPAPPPPRRCGARNINHRSRTDPVG